MPIHPDAQRKTTWQRPRPHVPTPRRHRGGDIRPLVVHLILQRIVAALGHDVALAGDHALALHLGELPPRDAVLELRVVGNLGQVQRDGPVAARQAGLRVHHVMTDDLDRGKAVATRATVHASLNATPVMVHLDFERVPRLAGMAVPMQVPGPTGVEPPLQMLVATPEAQLAEVVEQLARARPMAADLGLVRRAGRLLAMVDERRLDGAIEGVFSRRGTSIPKAMPLGFTEHFAQGTPTRMRWSTVASEKASMQRGYGLSARSAQPPINQVASELRGVLAGVFFRLNLAQLFLLAPFKRS